MKKYIAITGGIGSGKTEVCKYLRDLGYSVFSCDDIYREIIKEKAYIEMIERTFDGVVVNGVIDKKALSMLIFSNEQARKRLNELAHPLIIDKLIKDMENCADNIVFAEVPLLFEGGYESLFNDIFVVNRNKEDRIAAVMKRDGVSKTDAVAKILSQFDYDKLNENKYDHSSKLHIISNDGTQDDLKRAIKNEIDKCELS
ncbi:MAG: dephospho-CoA kinase [Clostridiales bacterium]|nr:dephospho-CoA kinase [Clostridiales bacterium]